MNSHTQACNDAKLSVKAYQNLVGSLQGFDRLLSIIPTKDHVLLSSVFCFAVVKYAKPFVETMTSYGKTRYPVRHLKSDPAFDFSVHKHLIDLRNTLVAHDDLESIDPRILQMCMAVESAECIIPVSIGLSNKCLAYPVASEDIIKLKLHVTACVRGALNKLHDDIARIRDVTLSHPELAVESRRYSKNYGQGQIGGEGVHLKPPEFMGDEWLNNATPDFNHVHKGLLYEELRVRRDFYGPERIKLPDGRELQISPSQCDESKG